MTDKFTTCLWFDSEAEEAALFYTSVFKNSHIGKVARFGKEGFEHHGKPEGSVMTIEFEINGQQFLALNGGPVFKFSEAISLVIHCHTQDEIDYYWNALSEGGDPAAQQCGWLKDKYGLSWQVVPIQLSELMTHPDKAGAQRAAQAMFSMKKFDIDGLQKAFDGK